MFFGKLFKHLIFAKPGALAALKGTRVLAAVATINQLRALTPVLDRLASAQLLSLTRTLPGTAFPLAGAYLSSVPYLARVLSHKQRARGYQVLGYVHAFDIYWLTYGYYIASSWLLAGVRPQLLMLANDHLMCMRVLRSAASDLGITTCYIQHAAVSERFPPLQFSIAFLDGIDSAEKYDQPGSTGVRAFLTGIPKADLAVAAARARRDIRSVGICVNLLDPIERVREFVDELRRIAPNYRYVVRPHPRDARSWAKFLAVDGHSDARIEPPFDFLATVDAIVAGPSSIALEAALAQVLPLFMDFSESGSDPYGFVNRGLCRQVHSAAEAKEALSASNARPPTAIVRDYCATIGTPYEGRSAELVKELVNEQLSPDGIDLSRWRRIAHLKHLEAYELA